MVSAVTRLGASVAWMYLRSRRLDPARLGAELRGHLEQMGFTYIKMGQFLAFRFDILPAEVCEELGKLFDGAPEMPFEQVRARIEAELDGPLEQFFLAVEPKPLAAASLAQVHLATANDGEKLALKIQRPSARPDFEADVLIGRTLAKAIHATGLLAELSLLSLLDEFEAYTSREMDFGTEGRVATRIATQVGPGVRVPAVRWDLTTSRLLAMEYVDGVSLGTAVKLTKAGRHREFEELLPGVVLTDVIRTIALESLRQILVDGLFHADPHPGNIIVCRDGTVVYIDFGMFGSLTPAQRRDCAGYIMNSAAGHPDRSFIHFFRLVIPTVDLDRPAFKRDMVLLMRDWAEWTPESGGKIADRHLGTIMLRTLATMRENGTHLDNDLLLFWRVLFVLDSTALDLADQVDLIAILREFFGQQSPFRTQMENLETLLPDALSCRTGALATATRPGRAPQGGTYHVATTRRSRSTRSASRQHTLLLALPLVLAACAVVARG